MYKYLPITDVYAREILDSRGNPTVEVELLAGERYWGRAAVPAGASTGGHEAVEVRDGGERYAGLGVQQAVEHINGRIAPQITELNVFDQALLDRTLLEIDGTNDKSNLGANALLGVSMAAARAAADALRMPLYLYLGGTNAKVMPVPMMNIMNGGRHADNTIDIQEFMIMPVGACCFREGLRMCAEIYHMLKTVLKEEGHHTGVGDEGGFAPNLKSAREVLELMTRAVERSGYRPGEDIVFALDAAASELYDRQFQKYVLEGEGKILSAEEMTGYFAELAEAFPIASIEDPLYEEDWEGWAKMTKKLGGKVQLVGDDLFVTNPSRIRQGIREGAANAALIKVNQIGTLTETFDAIETAKQAGYRTILSHRSAETADTIIADIAVAYGTGQIKAGAPCRMERVEKYNRLLRIGERLGDAARYQNPFVQM